MPRRQVKMMMRIRANPEQAIDLVTASGRAAAARASMLMAYGLNAADRAIDADFHLPGFIQLVKAPHGGSAAQMEAFKADY